MHPTKGFSYPKKGVLCREQAVQMVLIRQMVLGGPKEMEYERRDSESCASELYTLGYRQYEEDTR